MTALSRRSYQAPSLPEVVWGADAGTPDAVAARCPVCGQDGDKAVGLTVVFTSSRQTAERLRLLSCPACRSGFYERPLVSDYGDDEMLTRGRAELYLQQGAGLSQLFRPLLRLPHAPGSRYLDIGCGFGFGVAFAIHSRGWAGLGVDPGQIATMGRRRLRIPIQQDGVSTRRAEAAGLFDIVMAAETIEHIADPAGFVAELAGMLAPGGVMILTTPNVAGLNRETPPGMLAAMLSPELHVVLHSDHGLALLCRRAGLEHVVVEASGQSLIVYASAARLTLAELDAASRAAQREHLEARAMAHLADDDLFFGMAGRCLLECANDADAERGARVRARLRERVRARFAIDIDHPVALPATVAARSLRDMAAVVPLNLAAILYSCAMLDLLAGVPRAQCGPGFRLAAAAARELRRATAELGMEDALSEDLMWVSGAEALLCEAERGAPDVPLQLAALLDAGSHGAAGRGMVFAARCFVTLVNGGHLALARQVGQDTPGIDDPALTMSQDVLFCRGILALNLDGDAAAACRHFAQVRRLFDGGTPGGLFWPALRGELHALVRLGDTKTATALCYDVVRQHGAFLHGMPDDLREPVIGNWSFQWPSRSGSASSSG